MTEEVFLIGFSMVLQSAETDITCARQSEEARGYLEKNVYDAVLIDLCLSKTAAFEGIDLIKYARLRNPSGMVIVITAYGYQEIHEKVFDCGADLLYEKPVSPILIKNIIFKTKISG